MTTPEARLKEKTDAHIEAKFWPGFWLGATTFMTLWFIILQGLNWHDQVKAEGNKPAEWNEMNPAWRAQGLPYACSTTFEHLMCYQKNHLLYEVALEDPSEHGGNLTFVQNHKCENVRTVPQHNRYDPDRDAIHIETAFDVYDCEQFGNVFLHHLTFDFPK